MDVAALRDRIQSTLDSNVELRRRAERDLKYAEEQPGFLGALLHIVQTESEPAVSLSAAVYLKNRVTRGWQAADEYPDQTPIPETEKATLRQQLLPVLTAAPHTVRPQLLPLLQKVLQHDFPERWPDFVNITMRLMNAHDAPSVFAGLQCLLSLGRAYRFRSTENRTDFDTIVQLAFPSALRIGADLIRETSQDAGEMLRVIMKCFKHATFYELPPHLRQHDPIVGWCSLFLQTVAKELPDSSVPDDPDERAANDWWRSKKWAYGNLNRLFVRYGNPTALQKTSRDDYNDFSKHFIDHFAPEILKAYLQQIDRWVSKTAWLSKPCLSLTLAFLDECIKPKSMWAHLKPHMDNLIAHLLFPILCQSDDDLELFESDPQEYLHRKLNSYEEVSAPDVAATNFLVSLTKSRKKQTFVVLAFINAVVDRYDVAPAEQKNPREKEGALRMLGTLAAVILEKQSPIADQAERFFVRHVFPEFRSPHGYLRARACDTLGKFDQLNFTDPNNLSIIYRNILESMTDPDLPVRVEAALALQPLIRHDAIRQAMQQNIPQIMQQLLKLANEVDVDALANVMEDFVEVFAAELTPFAVALAEQLRDTYMRIVRELIDRHGQKATADDDTYGEFLDDKCITALGVLQTIGTLILTLESTPDVLAHLETILLPVIAITLDNKLYETFEESLKLMTDHPESICTQLDLFNEIFEIIDSCTFSAKSISPTMWQAFELMHKTFKNGAELYLEEMLPALDNYVTFGSQRLLQHPAYLQAVAGMTLETFRNERFSGVDRICGCKLAESLMLNLRGHVDPYIPAFIELGMTTLMNDEAKVKSYRVHLMEMVINSTYYDPILTLQVLESKGWTNKFFSLWFSNIDSFTRVHDKKLSVAAIVALLGLRPDQVPASVQQGWPRLLQGIVRLFQTLPAAIKHREEVTKEDFGASDDVDDEDEGSQGWGDDGNWTADIDDAEEDVNDESAAYIDFLHDEAQKFRAASDTEDNELEEESLLESPLEKIEPYGLFRDALIRLQHEQPGLYENLTKSLTQEEQAIIQGVVDQAEAKALAAAQAHVQGQVQVQTHGNGIVSA